MRNLLVGALLACAAASAAAQQPLSPPGYFGAGLGVSRYHDFCGGGGGVVTKMGQHGGCRPATCSDPGSVWKARSFISVRRTSRDFC